MADMPQENASPLSSGSDPSDEIVNSESEAANSSAATSSLAVSGVGDGPPTPAASSSVVSGISDDPLSSMSTSDGTGNGPPSPTSSTATTGDGDGPPECPICLQPSVHPVQLPCGHIFCFLCIKGVALRDPERRCALCRATVPDSVFLNPPIQNATQLSQIINNTTTPSGYQWWYESRSGGWWQYDERAMNELERVFTSNQPTCQLSLAGRIFEIDFQQMVQYPQNQPNIARRIRRETSIPENERLGVAGIPLDPSSGTGNIGIPAPVVAQGDGALGLQVQGIPLLFVGSDDEEDDDVDMEDDSDDEDDPEEVPAPAPVLPQLNVPRLSITINGRTLSGTEVDPARMAELQTLISSTARAASALMTDMERSIHQVGDLLNTVSQLFRNERPASNRRRSRPRTDPEDEDTAGEPVANTPSSNRDRSRSPR